jgi:hypothetical protein
MNVKELKEIIKNLPDDTFVQLLDLTTDSIKFMTYYIAESDLKIENYYSLLEDNTYNFETPKGKVLYISFENKVIKNSIL